MKVLDPNERKKLWDQIDEASRKLGVMTMPKLHVGMKVEKGGIVLCDQREEGHSWTRNMWNAIFGTYTNCGGTGNTFGAGYLSGKDTGGFVEGTSDESANFFYIATKTPTGNYGFCYSGTDNSTGIVLGTGDTAFDVDQYTMAALIGAGNSAGQLYHNAMVRPTLDYTAYVWTASLVRVFNNNSGDTITVKEVGIQTRSALFNANTGCYFLLARDVLASPVSVVNGAQLTVTYEISMDFSSIDT